MPRRIVPTGAIVEPADRRHAVGEQDSGHPESDPEDGAHVRVEEEELPAAPGASEPPADQFASQSGSRRTALQIPRVRGRHRGDRPTDRDFRQPAVGLDLEHFGHGRESTDDSPVTVFPTFHSHDAPDSVGDTRSATHGVHLTHQTNQ